MFLLLLNLRFICEFNHFKYLPHVYIRKKDMTQPQINQFQWILESSQYFVVLYIVKYYLFNIIFVNISEKIETKSTPVLRIIKGQLKIIGHIMRKVGLEN